MESRSSGLGEHRRRPERSGSMNGPTPSNPVPQTVATDAALFREEAARARRYAAAMTDQKVIDQLNHIAMLYEGLSAGQNPGPSDRN